MKEIPLGKSKVAYVDEEDYEDVIRYKWHAQKGTHTYYARRRVIIEGKEYTILLHRYLMGVTDPKVFVDHEDNNGLMCTRSNMRICTHAQNQMNRLKRNGACKYKGVSYNKKDRVFEAYIKINNKKQRLGGFKREKEAAVAYNNAALIHFKEFANLNIIE